MFRRNFMQSVLSFLPSFWLVKPKSLIDQKIKFGDRVKTPFGDKAIGIVVGVRDIDPLECDLDWWDEKYTNWRQGQMICVMFNGAKLISHKIKHRFSGANFPSSLLTKVADDTPFT